MMKRNLVMTLCVLMLTAMAAACKGGGGGGAIFQPPPTTTSGIWTRPGLAERIPKIRRAPTPPPLERALAPPPGTDANGDLWLFGGDGYDSTGAFGHLNDLWKFNGTNWTWVSGADTGGQQGVYGTKGVAVAANVPGGRHGSVSWTDASGNLWLFGGTGYDVG